MPRRRPHSANKKKEAVQMKRARKRGEDVPPPPSGGRKPPRVVGRSGPSTFTGPRLESRFASVSAAYVERTRVAAFKEVLPRPLPLSSAVFPLELLRRPSPTPLTVPARPKFRYSMTKLELEKNEEGVFRKWLAGTRQTLAALSEQDGEEGAPSWFETNLEVWRQLWRVVESSSILLLLCDARCPPLHCPPSLKAYIRALRPRREVVLVLTKADLVDPGALEGWKEWLKQYWSEGEDGAEVQVVTVKSYDFSSGRRKPAIPAASRKELLAALEIAHKRLLRPPEWAANDPEKLKSWKPPVRTSVDWDALDPDAEEHPSPSAAKASTRLKDDATERQQEGDEQQAIEHANEEGREGGTATHRDPQSEPLTMGLVGQPNVGKSSLLNALLGVTRVRASKTPGKTKHFQTILWGGAREVKIVDCPGLVCPSPAPMELQAMSGILPIAHIPSLAACTSFVARHLPLEEVFNIPPPPKEVDELAAKKTWREPRDTLAEKEVEVKWTAGEIMEGRALDRGFLTAKGGRPDANRAANAMLRAVAEGKVRWGFWPPGADVESRRGLGVWLGNEEDMEEATPQQESESESEEEDGDGGEEGGVSDVEEADEEDEEDEDEEESDDADGFAAQNKASFFAALSMEDDEDVDDED